MSEVCVTSRRVLPQRRVARSDTGVRAGAVRLRQHLRDGRRSQTHQVVPRRDGHAARRADRDDAARRCHQRHRRVRLLLRAARSLHGRIEMSGFSTFERKNITLPANERLSLGTVTMAIGGIDRDRDHDRGGQRSFRPTSSDRSALLTSTQLEMVAVRGRDVDVAAARAARRVAYQGESEAPGGSFGTTTPEHQRQSKLLEHRHGRRPRRQRPREPADLQRHDQLRRHQRSEGAVEQLPGGERPQRRRHGQHRHQVGNEGLQGHRDTSTSATRS